MPEYVKDSLIQFQHALQKLTDKPHKHTIPVFRATIKYAESGDTSKNLNEDRKKFMQQVTGTFLYYAPAVDPTIMVALSEISSSQAAITEATRDKAKYFLDY